jgi:hypothetical protein
VFGEVIAAVTVVVVAFFRARKTTEVRFEFNNFFFLNIFGPNKKKMNASNMRITVSCAHRGSWEVEYERNGLLYGQ